MVILDDCALLLLPPASNPKDSFLIDAFGVEGLPIDEGRVGF